MDDSSLLLPYGRRSAGLCFECVQSVFCLFSFPPWAVATDKYAGNTDRPESRQGSVAEAKQPQPRRWRAPPHFVSKLRRCGGGEAMLGAFPPPLWPYGQGLNSAL